MDVSGQVEKFLNIIKKHGAIAVLAFWLFTNNLRIEKLEAKLFECYTGKKTQLLSTKTSPRLFTKLEAVLPDKRNSRRYLLRVFPN